MRLPHSVVATGVFVVVSLSCAAQSQDSQQKRQLDLSQMMNATQFGAFGLGKLSPQELEQLNDWISNLVVQVYQTAHGGGETCGNVIESQINDEFEGWSGETVFKLANGQIWQQASYAYTYHYAYRPAVTIFPSTGGCKMKVEGVDDSILVNRLR